ncbi:MAG: divalent-cation tolerance protein CutA [Candidatus Ranarchaeia archaeon]|jgi:periplasmic divalent cation tolerance protein
MRNGGGQILKVVLTTLEKKSDALKIAKKLVEVNLAACVQMIPIQSIYRWKENIEDAKEIILIIKTSNQKLSKLVEILEREHPYDVPEIISIDPSMVGEKYLSWLLNVTKSEV